MKVCDNDCLTPVRCWVDVRRSKGESKTAIYLLKNCQRKKSRVNKLELCSTVARKRGPSGVKRRVHDNDNDVIYYS